jgi:hypothetical protein
LRVGTPVTSLPADFWVNFGERTATASVALIATAYYLNIVAFTSARGVGLVERKTRVARFPDIRLSEGVLSGSLRASAVVPVGLQLVAMLRPDWWGPTTVIGGFVIALNNVIIVRFIAAANENQKRANRRPIISEDLVGKYGRWGVNLFVYSATVGAVWILLHIPHHHHHLAGDVIVYTAVISVINVVRMFGQDCVRDAPPLRAALARAVHVTRRDNQLELRG